MISVTEALQTIRKFAAGEMHLHQLATRAYHSCVQAGIPVERYIELEFMRETNRPDPDLEKRKLLRLHLKGINIGPDTDGAKPGRRRKTR